MVVINIRLHVIHRNRLVIDITTHWVYVSIDVKLSRVVHHGHSHAVYPMWCLYITSIITIIMHIDVRITTNIILFDIIAQVVYTTITTIDINTQLVDIHIDIIIVYIMFIYIT